MRSGIKSVLIAYGGIRQLATEKEKEISKYRSVKFEQ